MMPHIKKILFATDLSKQARKAFGYAASLSDHYGAQLVILHVMEETSPSVDSLVMNVVGPERLKEMREQSEQTARGVLIGKKRNREEGLIQDAIGELCNEMQATGDWKQSGGDEIVVTPGNVVEEISRIAGERDCDLIVMGHYSRSMLSKAVMGSVTRGVLKQGQYPVLIVNLEK